MANDAQMPDVRRWDYYPIEMPLTADGKGPATVGVDAVRITYEVWDRDLLSHASYDNLPGAINEAMRLNAALPSDPAADLCASGQQVRAVEMLGELLAYDEWRMHNGGVVPDRFLGVINRARDAYRAALTPAPQHEVDPTLPWRMAFENVASMAEKGVLSMDGGQAATEIRSLAPERTPLPAPQPDAKQTLTADQWRNSPARLAAHGVTAAPYSATPTAQEAEPTEDELDEAWKSGFNAGFGEAKLTAQPPKSSETVAELVGWWERQLEDVQNYPAPLFAEKIKQTVAALRALKGEDE